MKRPSRFFDQPFHIDVRGRAAETHADDHVRDLIAAVLFTSPGERVNLPDFGCGVRSLVFAPNSELLASATEALIASSLDRWLADWITVERVEVEPRDSTLYIAVSYVRRDTREPGRLEFSA